MKDGSNCTSVANSCWKTLERFNFSVFHYPITQIVSQESEKQKNQSDPEFSQGWKLTQIVRPSPTHAHSCPSWRQCKNISLILNSHWLGASFPYLDEHQSQQYIGEEKYKAGDVRRSEVLVQGGAGYIINSDATDGCYNAPAYGPKRTVRPIVSVRTWKPKTPSILQNHTMKCWLEII